MCDAKVLGGLLVRLRHEPGQVPVSQRGICSGLAVLGEQRVANSDDLTADGSL